MDHTCFCVFAVNLYHCNNCYNSLYVVADLENELLT